MQIQQNNSQLNFKGRAFNMDKRWLRGKQAQVVEEAVEKLNSMSLIKEAECDILIFQHGIEHDNLAVIAQKLDDFGPKNKPLWRRAKTSSSNLDSVIDSAKTVIEEYNEKILPLHKNPKGFKSVMEWGGINCVHAEPIPLEEQAPAHNKIYEFGKKVFTRLFT